MYSVAYERKKSRFISSLKEISKKYATEKQITWQKYENHCATFIQKHYRGHRIRFSLLDMVVTNMCAYKRLRLMNAIVKSYRVRLILHPNGYHRGLYKIKNEIREIT